MIRNCTQNSVNLIKYVKYIIWNILTISYSNCKQKGRETTQRIKFESQKSVKSLTEAFWSLQPKIKQWNALRTSNQIQSMKTSLIHVTITYSTSICYIFAKIIISQKSACVQHCCVTSSNQKLAKQIVKHAEYNQFYYCIYKNTDTMHLLCLYSNICVNIKFYFIFRV